MVVVADEVQDTVDKEESQLRPEFPRPGLTGGRLGRNHHVPQEVRRQPAESPLPHGKGQDVSGGVHAPIDAVEVANGGVIHHEDAARRLRPVQGAEGRLSHLS